MAIKKISRKKAYTIAALTFIAVIVAFLWRDLNLTDRSDIPLPDIIVENIEIDREINGAQWKLISPRVEHRDGFFYGTLLTSLSPKATARSRRSMPIRACSPGPATISK